jgi:hypothetical protein
MPIQMQISLDNGKLSFRIAQFFCVKPNQKCQSWSVIVLLSVRDSWILSLVSWDRELTQKCTTHIWNLLCRRTGVLWVVSYHLAFAVNQKTPLSQIFVGIQRAFSIIWSLFCLFRSDFTFWGETRGLTKKLNYRFPFRGGSGDGFNLFQPLLSIWTALNNCLISSNWSNAVSPDLFSMEFGKTETNSTILKSACFAWCGLWIFMSISHRLILDRITWQDRNGRRSRRELSLSFGPHSRFMIVIYSPSDPASVSKCHLTCGIHKAINITNSSLAITMDLHRSVKSQALVMHRSNES